MKKISKRKLEEYYNNHTNKETAQWLSVSLATLVNYLNFLGIPKKGKGNRTKPKLIQFKD